MQIIYFTIVKLKKIIAFISFIFLVIFTAKFKNIKLISNLTLIFKILINIKN